MTTYQRIYANNAKTTVASTVGSTDTSIIVVDASKFPTPSANQFFDVTLDNGTTIEVVEVHGVSGNVLTGCVRGQEGTVASNFLVGTRAENRVTAGTLSSFARLVDRVANIASVDLLATTTLSTSNSYLCASTDDSGAPIVAIANGSFWRFVNHPTKPLTGTSAGTGSYVSMPLTGAVSTIPITTSGSHIIQFTTGLNAGLCRIVSNTDASNVYWSTVLPNNVLTGDTYEIYQSSAYSLGALNTASNTPLIYSILFGE